MVRVSAPLGSMQARGKMGCLIYEVGRYGQYCKMYTPQRKRPSEAQKEQNYKFGTAADKWRILSDEEKEEWTKRAVGLKMTGFNLFIKENIDLSSKIGEAIIGKDKIA